MVKKTHYAPGYLSNWSIQVRYYGLMYAIGILCALYLIRREVRRRQITFSDDDVMNFVMLSRSLEGLSGRDCITSSLVGEHYRDNLWEIRKSGMAVWPLKRVG